ncbi:unnamed protein product, partial [Sphacelaria rigidula]
YGQPPASLFERKTDDSLRLCQDYRGLNQLLESYSGSLRDMQTMYGRLAESKYSTIVDLTNGFFQLEVEEVLWQPKSS